MMLKRMGASPRMERMAGDRMGRGSMGMKKGGETKAMMKKEVSFMKKKGAPKSMIKHEEREMKGGKKGYKEGGSVFRKVADGIASKGKTKGKQVRMYGGGKC